MNRDVVLIIYAAAMGWLACSWWRGERQRLVWDAADELAAREDARKRFQAEAAPHIVPDPEPAT